MNFLVCPNTSTKTKDLFIFFHIPLHLLIGIILGFALVPSPYIWPFILSGLFIDIDHIIYYLLSTKPFCPRLVLARIFSDHKNHIPRFYIFHSFEFFILIFSLYIVFLHSSLVYFILLGLFARFLTDIVIYLFIYRGDYLPWFPYLFLLSHLTRNKKD